MIGKRRKWRASSNGSMGKTNPKTPNIIVVLYEL